MTLAGSAHQTAAQRGGEAKDKDKPLSDMQRDKYSTARLPCHLLLFEHNRLLHYCHDPPYIKVIGICCSNRVCLSTLTIWPWYLPKMHPNVGAGDQLTDCMAAYVCTS